jgi:hypothetical protein
MRLRITGITLIAVICYSLVNSSGAGAVRKRYGSAFRMRINTFAIQIGSFELEPDHVAAPLHRYTTLYNVRLI